MPRWSVFKLEPVDEAITSLGGDDGAYTLDWVQVQQYWCTNEYDAGVDLRTRAGVQIRLTSHLWVETMAIFRGWNMAEIVDHFRKLYSIPDWQRIVLAKKNEEEYEWRLEEDEAQARPEKAQYVLLIGGGRLENESRKGSTEHLAELFSRCLHIRMPPICLCEIAKKVNGRKVIIKYDLGSSTTRNHALVFYLPNLEVSTGVLQALQYTYDKRAIMEFGHQLDDRVPKDEARAEFPDEPWTEHVDIVIKTGDLSAPLC
jgi:hypothetical protein